MSECDDFVPAKTMKAFGGSSVDSTPEMSSWSRGGVIAKLSQVRTGEDPRILMARISIWLHWFAASLAFILMAIPPTNLQLALRITPLAVGAIVFTVPLRAIPWGRLNYRYFVTTSFIDMALIATGVSVSGQTTSRYQLLLFLVVVFAAYFYPIGEAAVVIACTIVVFISPLIYQESYPSTMVPIVASAAGVMVLVGGVTKHTVLRYERERSRRDTLELEREQLYEQEVQRRTALQEKTRQLESILETGNAFRLRLGLDALLQMIVSAICETGRFRASVVRLFNPETGAAEARAAHGVDWEIVLPPTPPEIIRKLMDEKYRVSHSYLLDVDPEMLEQPDVSRYLYIMPEERPRTGSWKAETTLIVPLETGEHGLIGIISIDEPLSGEIPSVDTIQTLEIFANLAATAIDNARLLEEASQAQALRELDRLKSEFLATVSHDLRTPLTVIKGSIDLLEDRVAELSDTQVRLVKGIGRNTQRLMDMVEQLLDMIQLQDGRIVLHETSFDIQRLVLDVSESLTVAATARNQDLVVRGEQHPIPVFLDRGRIQQVVANLISNACKYGPANSPITVSIQDQGENVLISVHDQGGNIPLSEQQRIFEKFFRSQATSSDVTGTGLGLAICESLVELHGGQVSVKSDAEHGTCFSVKLPTDRRQS